MPSTCTGHCLEHGLVMTPERLVVNLVTAIGGYAMYACCFYIMHDRPFDLCDGYGLIKRIYPEAWAKLGPVDRGDWASRGHSSLNAIVVLGLIPAMLSCGIWGDPLANDCHAAEIFFSLIVGYFLFDYAIVLYYKMAFWQVFLVHHTFAISPYLINNFLPEASACQYLIGIFIQVEIATLVLNYQNMLEITERTNTTMYKVVFYGCYVLWAVIRIAMPLYICMTLVNEVMPYYGSTPHVVVCYICAFFVLTFCTIVWLFVLTPDVLVHLKGPTTETLLTDEDEDSSALALGEGGGVPSTSFQVESAAGSSTRSSRTTSVFKVPKLGGESGASNPVFRSRGSSLAHA